MSVDTSRRAFFKKAGVASAALLGSQLAVAGVREKDVKKFDETFDVVVIGSGDCESLAKLALMPCTMAWLGLRPA